MILSPEAFELDCRDLKERHLGWPLALGLNIRFDKYHLSEFLFLNMIFLCITSLYTWWRSHWRMGGSPIWFWNKYKRHVNISERLILFCYTLHTDFSLITLKYNFAKNLNSQPSARRHLRAGFHLKLHQMPRVGTGQVFLRQPFEPIRMILREQMYMV